MTRISIIIPCYNAEKYIHQCLESIYGQGLQENSFEVIIVNDGSKDKSIESIRDFTEKYQNLKIINQTNQGVSIARNNGLKAAQGTYVWFVDADDMLTGNCLTKILDIAEKYALDILKMRLQTYSSHIPPKIEKTPTQHCNSKLTCKSGTEEYIENFDSYNGYVWEYIFLRKFLLKNHLTFLEHCSFCEDYLFSTSALLAAPKMMSIPIAAYIYRQHKESATHTLNKKDMLSLNIVIEQVYMLSKRKHLNPQLRKKMRFCIFQQLCLNLWILSHTPVLYSQRWEIIADLKNRIPFFMLKHSFHEWRFSIYYSFCPYFYVWARHHLDINRHHIS